MKINPELSSVINMVKKENGYQKRTQETGEQKQKVEDMVSVQNTVASRSQVENVEEARALLSDVVKDMNDTSTDVHELNQYRISRLIS